jgi:hypothetical protein
MANCIVIVHFDLPNTPEATVIERSLPNTKIYRGLGAKGLIRKDYINGASGAGGVYLWDNRKSAETWYTEELLADLTKRFGVRPRLTWFDTHITVDNVKGETRVNGVPTTVAA